MHFEKFNKGKIIFNKDEQGDKFYFILQGFVSVWAPKSESELNKEIELNGELLKN